MLEKSDKSKKTLQSLDLNHSLKKYGLRPQRSGQGQLRDDLQRIQRIKTMINEKLIKFAAEYKYHPDLKNFVTEANNIFLSPDAKRIRAIIPVLIGESLELDIETCLLNGAAIELLHFTSLIHDDVIDNHNFRRGYPSLNNTFAQNHAVLIGDYMMCEVIHLCLRSKYNSEVIRLMVDAVKKLVTGLIIEQNVMPLSPTLENYSEMVDCKTGSLFKLSFCLPFVADQRFVTAEYCGKLFGLLFQIYDDYLDQKQDQSYQNIFHITSRADISNIWDENYSKLLAAGRNIEIETVILDLVQYLQSHGYFLDI
jgi:geranylgeranyl pyrophosphate synthase